VEADESFRTARQDVLQTLDDARIEPLVFGGDRVENLAAPDGAHRGIAAHDVMIAFDDGDRRIQPQLGDGGLAGLELIVFEQDQVSRISLVPV